MDGGVNRVWNILWEIKIVSISTFRALEYVDFFIVYIIVTQAGQIMAMYK